ncbi:Aste57867_10193 [Aphanomyces stellatus]|uniref:Aste57867_10193 protein n=1 Tax=Aphanomyces stellatus TaxID=120398 RepID=A0A485KPR1_9STRA|nr:hypothetical protein As57867_010154 [Aphanomyces stellatus]VFT87069.1 Aste57867_10193 [Aphanomyces stellatus]
MFAVVLAVCLSVITASGTSVVGPPSQPTANVSSCSIASIAASVTWPALETSNSAITAYELQYQAVSSNDAPWVSWSNHLTGRPTATPYLQVQTILSRSANGATISSGYFRLTSSYNSIADVDTRTGLAVTPLLAFNAAASDVKAGLESIHDVLHVEVVRSGPDTTGGYAWHVEFHENHTRPMLGIHTNMLDNGIVTLVNTQSVTTMCTSTCTAIVSSLASHTAYLFRVRAAVEGTWGPWSAVSDPFQTCTIAVPTVPSKLHASSVSATGISMAWTSPATPTLSLPVLSYTLASLCAGQFLWHTIDVHKPFGTVQTALPNTQCQIRVAATNAVGTGPWSSVVTVVSSPGPPQPPLGITLSTNSPTTLSIHGVITPPTDTGGSPLGAYVVQITPVDDIEWLQLPTPTGLTLDWQPTAPYTRYVARAAATNGLGQSSWVMSNIVRSDMTRIVYPPSVDTRARMPWWLLSATLAVAANTNDKYYIGGTANGGTQGGDGQPGAVFIRLFALDGSLLKETPMYYTGSLQNYSIPPSPQYERTWVDVYAWGGGGGSADVSASQNVSPGGGGGFARASFPVHPGDVVQVAVGGGGAGARNGGFGGYGGGGPGGPGTFAGGGGGGASSVKILTGSTSTTSVLIAPGGGGGGGADLCCAAGGAGGGVNGSTGIAPTAAQIDLPLAVASRDEFHSRFDAGDTRDATGRSAKNYDLEFGNAPGADYTVLAGGGTGAIGSSGGIAGTQSSFQFGSNRGPTMGQAGSGGQGGEGRKGGGGGGGGYFGGGGGGGGLDGGGGGGGSGFVLVSAVVVLPPQQALPVPQQVTATPDVSTLLLQWQPPPTDVQDMIIGYAIEFAIGQTNEDYAQIGVTTQQSFVVDSLLAATDYSVRVKLLTRRNQGGYSPRVVVQTLPDPVYTWQLVEPQLLMQSNVAMGFRHVDGPFGTPSPRRGHSMVVIGDYSYMFGGFGPGYPCQRATSDVCYTSSLENNELWRYHSPTQSWLQLSVVGGVQPAPREKHTAAVVAGKMLVFGGRQLNGGSRNDLWQLDVGATSTITSTQMTPNVPLTDGGDSWTTVLASTDPTNQCIQSMQVMLTLTHGCLNTLEIYLYGPGPSTSPPLQQDIVTGTGVLPDQTWSMAAGIVVGDQRITPSSPATRGHRVQLYGLANASMLCLSGTQTLVLDTTTSLEPLNAFFHLPAAGIWTLEVYDRALDGQSGTLQSWQISWTMEACTPIYQWTNVTNTIQGTPPPPRYQHTSVVVGNSLFVFGGKDIVELQDLYRLDYVPNSPSNVWTTLSPVGLRIMNRRYGQLLLLTPFHALVPSMGLTQTTFDEVDTVRLYRQSVTEPTSTWTDVAVANTSAWPSQRYFAASTWWLTSPSQSKLLVFGGQDHTGFLSDLWELSLTNAWQGHDLQAASTVCPWMFTTRLGEWTASCGTTTPSVAQPCSLASILLAAWCQPTYQTVHNLF